MMLTHLMAGDHMTPKIKPASKIQAGSAPDHAVGEMLEITIYSPYIL
jgi:hypothetical protein